jgi:hypothetical protein
MATSKSAEPADVTASAATVAAGFITQLQLRPESTQPEVLKAQIAHIAKLAVATARAIDQEAQRTDPVTGAAALAVTALVPATAVLGSPSFTIHVQGAGFGPDAVIVWNGSAEPTTVVSPTEVTTEVNMDSAQYPVTIPVAVSSWGHVSNAVDFTFTEAASRRK